ncbi:MAG: phage major capsid protein [Muribaculaceae bacterium]|nr:phage major capsid protein [Muribaculaceae bacterium]
MKKKVNVRELVEKYRANCDRISEIAAVCENENRERSAAETAEYEALARENQLLQMKMQAASAEYLRENPNARAEVENVIRENVKHGRKTEFTFMRSGEFAGIMVSDANSGGIIPLNIQDIIRPLEEGFILDKVGLPMPTGLVGDFVWPIYETVDASVAGEGVALSDSKIEFSKLTATPERIGLAIPVTNQALNASAGVLEMIVREVMPQAIRQLLNKIVFGLDKVANATYLAGPFANINAVAAKVAAGTTLTDEEKKYAAVVDLHATPTFVELNKRMKAAVLEKGIEGNRLCWVMTKSQQAILEGTPINSNGIYVPMIQDGRLCGLPVYTSNALRKVVVSYKKATISGSGSSATTTWADYTLQASDDIDFKVSVATDSAVSAALAGLTGVANNDIAQITVVNEYIGLGDWGYQPMGLFGSLRFIVDPYSQARKDSVDFVLNADYATKTLRPEAFILGHVGTATD